MRETIMTTINTIEMTIKILEMNIKTLVEILTETNPHDKRTEAEMTIIKIQTRTLEDSTTLAKTTGTTGTLVTTRNEKTRAWGFG